MKAQANTTVENLTNLGWSLEGYEPEMDVKLISDDVENTLTLDFETNNPDINMTLVLSDNDLTGLSFVEIPETEIEKMF